MSITPTFNEQNFVAHHHEFAHELSNVVLEAGKLIDGMEPFLERFLSDQSKKWTQLDVTPYFEHMTYRTERCLKHLNLHRQMIEEYDAQLQQLDSDGKITGDTFALMSTNNRHCLKQVEDYTQRLEEAYSALGGNIIARFPNYRATSRAIAETGKKPTSDQFLIKKLKL